MSVGSFCCLQSECLQEYPIRIAVEHHPADRLEVRVARLDLLRQRMDIAEPALERRAAEDGGRASGLVNIIGDLDGRSDGVGTAKPYPHTGRQIDRRDIVGARPVIGRSSHSADDIRAALTEAVDYFCVGPCWPTPTKPGHPAPGLDLIRSVAALTPHKPWFAIGGIDEARLADVLAAGATRVVVVRAITSADDPQAAARRLAAALPAVG